MELLEDVSDEDFERILAEIETPISVRAHLSEESANQVLAKVLHEIERIEGSPNHVAAVSGKTVWFTPWLRIAAAVCVLLVGAAWYWSQILNKDETTSSSRGVYDVDPASPMATVTLENGEVVRIDSSAVGLVYSKDGMQIYKDENGALTYQDSTQNEPIYLTVSTPKGGIMKVRLDDSTVVELNAGATLRYPSAFTAKKREVYLEGEAFFSVAHDATKPFEVHMEKQIIEVLGTSFNVVSRADYARTTLVEGRVKILTGGKAYFLKPGEQAMVTNEVKISSLNPTQKVAWKNEEFTFDHSTFYEILQEIESWYNVQVVFADNNLEDVHLSGTVSRKVKLSALLKVLEMNTNYKFTIEERRVLVTKN